MALRLHVCLPSGLSCELGPFPPDSAVAELRSGAEKALGRPVRLMGLIGPDGLLEEHLSLQSAKLHDHDTVGAIADWPKMVVNRRGAPDSSRLQRPWFGASTPAELPSFREVVQALLETTQIQHVQSSDRAFAAILDGAVVTWGHERAGLGDPNYGIERPKLLEPVEVVARVRRPARAEELQSVDGFNGGAFAARSANGAVSTWGDCKRGGDSRGVQEQLRQVRQLQASRNAFAAITEPDGRVVTWGLQEGGGDSTAVQDQLHHVEKIQALQLPVVSCGFAGDAFAAIRSDGRVVTWGWAESGGDSSRVEGRLREVQELQATSGAFCALRADGRVVTWGRPLYGGHVPPEVSEQLREVQEIQASSGAFAALRRNGVVVAWGDPSFGGDCSEVQEQLTQVRQIQSTVSAFAAISSAGTVVTWGFPSHGGDSSQVQEQLKKPGTCVLFC
ncbi:Probable E3 ubiquitin-protein ligase HERC2 (HECT domain and RCC1-like domain-containing protein 2) (HECT-type E3 ubiquitin transferase HERC2) [Durusdinium trenchii]|uniref:Probable E3 ubiquitin-protein ligase HERC2 (HECT domain and RCC1-like domain-containing protein 2) (HECT-type E3 ubiquitin transferase HERC2) n=1 Tax=Durusdinium trenchii TaxID=1381693 RepID=A0ABP0IJW3_9DINO